MFLRSFLDEIIYEKQKNADIDNAFSTAYSRKTFHDVKFKYGGFKYVKNFGGEGNEKYKLINELTLLSFFEKTK